MVRWSVTALVIALAFAGCVRQAEGGGQDLPVSGGGDTSAGMCAPDTPDCVDMVVGDGGDEFDTPQAREDARALLGTPEADLAGSVRVARRGDEHMALTEDYVLGRMTVELDAKPDGAHIVTAVTVELPEGPETFRR